MPSELQAKLAAMKAGLAAARRQLERLSEESGALGVEVRRLGDDLAGASAPVGGASAQEERGQRLTPRPLGRPGAKRGSGAEGERDESPDADDGARGVDQARRGP